MLLIGLTGGIAAGKSVVSNRLAERGAVVIDADRIAREVVEPGTPALAQIAATFGPGVIAADGTLDRAALAAIVFAEKDRLAVLNAITHPAVWRRTRELIDAAEAVDPDVVVVYDVPLLVEGAADRPLTFDLIVVVHANRETRIERMMSLRGMSREEALHRINAQASDTERLAVADIVIDSNGTVAETLAQADQLWASLPQRTRPRAVGGPA